MSRASGSSSRDTHANTSTHHDSASRPSADLREAKAVEEGHVEGDASRRPPARFDLVLWLRLHAVDILTMILVAACIIAAHVSDPAPTHIFPIFNTDGTFVYPEYAYPRRKQIIPTWASAVMAVFIPVVFFGIAQIRRRSLYDFLTTSMGLLKSVVTASFMQVVIKALIGGPRPHFFSACQPDLALARSVLASPLPSSLYPSPIAGGEPTVIPMFTRAICTGSKAHINDALKSMPSGHTTAAWSGLFFLALYFNAQLKVMGAANVAYWKMVLALAPVLGAALLSLYAITDAHHHPSDLVVGAAIGILTSLVAFRQTFAAVWDFRFNHVLLPRSTSLFYRHPDKYAVPRPWFDYNVQGGARGVMRGDWGVELPFTREGGWGLRGEDGWAWRGDEDEGRGVVGGVGAPGDAWRG